MRTRAEQIAGMKADQQFWRDLAAEVGPDRFDEPGPMGEWTFRDMAGHLLGWRNRTIARHRFILGPWRWMLIVYEYDEDQDLVGIVTVQDARSSNAATSS